MRTSLVVVSPPHETRVEIEGLTAELSAQLACDFPPEWASLGDRVVLESVSHLQVDAVQLAAADTRLSGKALVQVGVSGIAEDGGDCAFSIDFPMTFDVSLGADRRIVCLHELHVDTSSYPG